LDRGESVVRILIAQEQSLFRDALKLALDTEEDLDVAAEAGDAEAAVQATERAKPDVVILDARLPTVNGAHTGCLIKERLPECKILVLADEQDQRILRDGLGCGASGYLTKSSSVSEVTEAVRALHRGETLIPPVMLGPLLSQLIGRRREHEHALLKISELSRREREVLGLVARGSSTNAIAKELVISPETARTHVQNILNKLDVHSRLEAAAFVIESGLLDHLPHNGQKPVASAEPRGK
jgi:two-component system NarL family response regulator